MNQEYVGCYVVDSSFTPSGAQGQTAQSTTECYNRATAAKARFFGMTRYNQCYFNDSTAYSTRGLQPAFMCMYDPSKPTTQTVGTAPGSGDSSSAAMYEISYSRTVNVIDALTVGQSVRIYYPWFAY